MLLDQVISHGVANEPGAGDDDLGAGGELFGDGHVDEGVVLSAVEVAGGDGCGSEAGRMP